MPIQTQFELQFAGRTILVESVYYTIIDPKFLSDKIRIACAGPELRMTVGGLSKVDGGYKSKTFINTDESEGAVAMRISAMTPAAAITTVGIVSERKAAKLWAEFRKIPHTQEGD